MGEADAVDGLYLDWGLCVASRSIQPSLITQRTSDGKRLSSLSSFTIRPTNRSTRHGGEVLRLSRWTGRFTDGQQRLACTRIARGPSSNSSHCPRALSHAVSFTHSSLHHSPFDAADPAEALFPRSVSNVGFTIGSLQAGLRVA
jgi:hypothetical protein